MSPKDKWMINRNACHFWQKKLFSKDILDKQSVTMKVFATLQLLLQLFIKE